MKPENTASLAKPSSASKQHKSPLLNYEERAVFYTFFRSVAGIQIQSHAAEQFYRRLEQAFIKIKIRAVMSGWQVRTYLGVCSHASLFLHGIKEGTGVISTKAMPHILHKIRIEIGNTLA